MILFLLFLYLHGIFTTQYRHYKSFGGIIAANALAEWIIKPPAKSYISGIATGKNSDIYYTAFSYTLPKRRRL